MWRRIKTFQNLAQGCHQGPGEHRSLSRGVAGCDTRSLLPGLLPGTLGVGLGGLQVTTVSCFGSTESSFSTDYAGWPPGRSFIYMCPS
jgi:hypothetical protein